MLMYLNFISENLDISLSRTAVIPGDWFNLICIQTKIKGKNFFNPEDLGT